MYETVKQEKALLVMIEVEREKWPREVLAEEFRNLVTSCGIEVVDLLFAKRPQITPSLYIGKGKAEEIALAVEEKGVDVVIFNNNLRFTQQRNLEEVIGVKTIDRTQLILDIFARHAHTREGILQVELAQYEYLLPRLRGKGIMLSRLGGGIGTRGPGEKKLEVDRRKITDRIDHLKKEIKEVKMHREVMRKKREKKNVNLCSLVGYTNAGKSTLFNVLTESDEKTSPGLFTTLDMVTRTFELRNNIGVILSDTVGFIYKLPPYLVESFKATLEELHYADLLLHIIDASSLTLPRLKGSVDDILKELELDSKPLIIIFNKIDKLSGRELEGLKTDWPQAVFIAALNKINIDSLKEKIYDELFADTIEVILKFPFNLMEIVKYIYENCEVLKTNYHETEVVCWVRAHRNKLAYLEKKGVSINKL